MCMRAGRLRAVAMWHAIGATKKEPSRPLSWAADVKRPPLLGVKPHHRGAGQVQDHRGIFPA
eukprot:1757695-Alexandrium_andersonii.AAC.1